MHLKTVLPHLLLSTCIASTCVYAQTEPATLTFAVPTFLTGPAAPAYGIPARNGVELVVDAINTGKLPAPYQTAGFAGLTAKIEFVDEAGGNTKQVAEYRNIVQKREVDAVIGYISSGSCTAITPVVEELKKLTVYAVCATPRIFEEASRQYIFRTMSHATADSVTAAHYVKDHFPDLKMYTGINQNYAFGQDSWRDFNLAMKTLMPNAKAASNPLFPKLFVGQYSIEISALLLDEATLVHSTYWGGDIEGLVFQGAARDLFKNKTFAFVVGGSSIYRLGKQMPDGQILGARGPYGILVKDRQTVLNQWFIKEYQAKYNELPNDAAYQFAQAILATKIAYDKAGINKSAKPSQEEVIAAFKGLEFESFSTHVKMALANGHQAITENGLGITHFDTATQQTSLQKVKFYPAECVNPPEGVESVAWLESGMAGATCP